MNYEGEELEVGFNVNYLMDALAAIEGQEVQIGLTDSNSSCLVQAPTDPASRFVVMPMRLDDGRRRGTDACRSRSSRSNAFAASSRQGSTCTVATI